MSNKPNASHLAGLILARDQLPLGVIATSEADSLIAQATASTTAGAHDVEGAARLIYESWSGMEGYVPWVSEGNAVYQDEARAIARTILAESHAETDAWRHEASQRLPGSERNAAPLVSDKAGAVIQLADSRVNRVYLAGPMTGYADYNFPAFNAEAARLRAQGLHVENPAEHGLVDGATWADYMRYDLGRIATCEGIHLLPGWSKSNGARIEVGLAQALGMHVGYAEGAEEVAALNPLAADVVQGGERLHSLQQCLRDNGEQIAADATIAQQADHIEALSRLVRGAAEEVATQTARADESDRLLEIAKDALRAALTCLPKASAAECDCPRADSSVIAADKVRSALATHAPAEQKAQPACRKPGCFPFCDCGSIDDAPVQSVAADVVQVSLVGGKYSEVLEPFFDMMNAELHANAHKGDRPGWLSMDRKTALLEIYYHLGKLHKAVHGDEAEGIREFAADVANMSMMLVDICGLLAARQADGGEA